jgi:adenine phosphoribosyltransferase
MPQRDLIGTGREALLNHFRWVDGHADVWRVFEDQGAFLAITRALACLAAEGQPTRVLGIETRGLLLAGAVATEVGAGVQVIRKSDGLLPGPQISIETAPDYRDRSYEFRMRATLGPADRVVLVDDWVERGSQARAARSLVERTGAIWLGTVAMVDDTDAETREDVGPFRTLVRSSDLGSDTDE